MTRVTLNPDIAKILLQIGEAAELCDQSGKPLGNFFPRQDAKPFEYAAPEISEEELDRRELEEESYTLDEVLTHLENLGCSKSDGKSQP